MKAARETLRKTGAFLAWIKGREQSWRITVVALAGLLVAITVAGVTGLLLNRNVERANETLVYDVDLEDEGDDLRAAVLDMRHYHRNLFFSGPTRNNLENLEQAHRDLQEEIRELEELGVRDPTAPQPEEIRRTAEAYWDSFNPEIATELYQEDETTGGRAFTAASNKGLVHIDEMNQAGEELDGVGEARADRAIQDVDQATATAKVVLISVIVGLLLVGAALAMAAVRVVNELRRLYAEQQETAEKLAEASRQKTDFLADVSHELRTPLTVLRGNAQVGLALGADGEQKQLLEEVVEESRRMSRMVEDLLFLSRSDSSLPAMEPETVSAVPLLSEISGRAGMLAREKGGVLKTDLGAEGSLRADSSRLSQAVLILVDNALKYGPPGGTVTLRSSVNRRGELVISVEDEGPGIPKDDLPRIFERFYRVDKARSRRMGGTGLGLPIAKTIVEAHEGHVTAESRPGRGTRMSIHLPMLEDRAETRPPTPAHREPQKS
jgi:two-component system, OmpR family, sensor histidine kinase VicK